MPVVGSMPRSRRWPVSIAAGHDVQQIERLGHSRHAPHEGLGIDVTRRMAMRVPPPALFSVRTDSFSCSTMTPPSFSASAPNNCTLHRPAEDVRRGKPLLAHLDAELGAQVGDGGGGSADSKRMKDER